MGLKLNIADGGPVLIRGCNPQTAISLSVPIMDDPPMADAASHHILTDCTTDGSVGSQEDGAVDLGDAMLQSFLAYLTKRVMSVTKMT